MSFHGRGRPELSLELHPILKFLPCPECGSKEHLKVHNYSWRRDDGDVYCMNLEQHGSGDKVWVRLYDAG